MLHSKKVLNGHLFCCKMKHDPSMDKKCPGVGDAL